MWLRPIDICWVLGNARLSSRFVRSIVIYISILNIDENVQNVQEEQIKVNNSDWVSL